jgi:hypothetical protein
LLNSRHKCLLINNLSYSHFYASYVRAKMGCKGTQKKCN